MNDTLKGYVDLKKYIDYSGEYPMIRGTDVKVATVAFRAMSGSWGLDQLCYQFTLREVEVLAALLYYNQHAKKINDQEGNFAANFEAMD